MRHFALAGPAGLFVAAAMIGLAFFPASAQSDAQIRQRIIRESIAAYPGSCPCPYNVDRPAMRCAQRLQPAGRLCADLLCARRRRR